tara:strand:- start:225 stop:1550 length:1326 start_codon:yes stop_codon:yes gene_type:complete
MASTFVNNLRLEEMATGEQSGNWGTKTNTNLELIGEALGFGTEGITTNADTHTTTVADASSDPGRAMFIKYTGTLDSACTITIAPNTLNRVHIIENGTSGSQNIIISQGSGANVTIAPGTVKAVYLDGAGSGAAVVDAFAHLAAVDLTVDDDLIVGDDLTFSSDSAVVTFGADGDTTLTHTDGTGLTLNSTNKLCFGDTGTFIHQSADGVLDLVSDSEVEINGSTIDINGDVDISGTTVSGGKITADAGIDIDNFNIDGTTIALSSGDMTLDAAGDIVLDADGADVIFKDDGTTIAKFTNSSSDFVITTDVDDKDFIVKGQDSTSEITAMTLDMSAAGAATFNNDVTAFSDKRLKTDISNIENALDKVTRMQGVYYKRNDVSDPRQQIGVLAQDMEEVLPEVVLTAEDEMQTKSVDYGKLTAVLIEAIKDLKAEIDELKKG